MSFATGQRLHVPLVASIKTPFLFASAPRMYFGTCAVGQECSGTLLLSNPTDVRAAWRVEYVPQPDGFSAMRATSTIRVKGFEAKGRPQEDDPSVFLINPGTGVLQGPTVSVTAAMAAPPRDVNRMYVSLSSFLTD